MLILGWTTNDYRGPKAWAALWSADDTPELREAAARHIAKDKLENAVLRWRDNSMSVANAKAQIITSLKL